SDDPQDLTTLLADAVPATRYRRSSDLDRYRRKQAHWVDYSLSEPIGRPCTDFYRLVWRRQIAHNSERSLVAALMPPGPTHVLLMRSMALESARKTTLA